MDELDKCSVWMIRGSLGTRKKLECVVKEYCLPRHVSYDGVIEWMCVEMLKKKRNECSERSSLSVGDKDAA